MSTDTSDVCKIAKCSASEFTFPLIISCMETFSMRCSGLFIFSPISHHMVLISNIFHVSSVGIVERFSWGMWRVVGCHLGFRASACFILPIEFPVFYNC
jgi:hypothetical protein